MVHCTAADHSVSRPGPVRTDKSIAFRKGELSGSLKGELL